MANSQELLILTAPPASGKTYWIYDFAKITGFSKLIVISPLRALRDECCERWGEDLCVMTPEEWLLKKVSAEIVIMDEFHLLFHWGNTFRPLMWEVFFELSSSANLVIGLTATLSKKTTDEIRQFTHFDRIWWNDCGNLLLKFNPRFYLKAPSRSWLLKELSFQPQSHFTSVVFCQYREEVLEVKNALESYGFSVIYCLGGEAGKMRASLRENPNPDMIVCTTVLSHGVNLPSVRKVYFLYEVKDPDFWIQMVARGGRKGEQFDVLSLQKPLHSEWSWWRNLLRIWTKDLCHKITLRGLFFVSK